MGNIVISLQDLEKFCLEEVSRLDAAGRKYTASIVDPPPDGIRSDYRLDDEQIRQSSITLLARDRLSQEALGISTLIYIDDGLADYLPILRLEDGNLFSDGVRSVIGLPAIMIGYTEFFAQSLPTRVALTRWYLALLKRCLELDVELFIEITGIYEGSEITDLGSLLGKVRPESRAVLSLARHFDMQLIEGYYEWNSFGPLYRKARL